MPAMCRRRVPCSRNASAYRRLPRTVSICKKPTAMMPWAWFVRNSRQVGPARRGAGSMPAAWRIFHTGRGDGVSESGQLALHPPLPPLCVLSSELQDQLLERCPDRQPSGAGAPGTVVPLRRNEPAMPGQQGPGSNREDLVPATTGYQAGEHSQPEPVRRLVTDRAGELTAQHRILMPQERATRLPYRCRGAAAPRGTDSSLRATLYNIEMITPTWSQPRTLYRPDLRR